MARIFTIRFTYEGTLHNALVFVKETPFHMEYKLNMLDFDLLKKLPSDKLISSPPDSHNLTFANDSNTEYSELMNEIIKAISEHIHTVQT